MPQIYGNTTGLSPSAHKLLERIYRRRVPLEHIATPELIRSLAEASHETGRQVGVLVQRYGEIEHVVVGDATKLMLPDIGRLRSAEGRLRGLRLVHTHLFGERLTRDDFVDLVRLRLDLVAAVQLTERGEPRAMHFAYNTPPREAATRPALLGLDPSGVTGGVTGVGGSDEPASSQPPFREVGPVALSSLDVNFGELVAALEDEFARTARRLRAVTPKDGRAILVHVADKSRPGGVLQAEESLRELAELARTAGVEVMDAVLQVRDRIDPKFVLGRGKLDDLVLRAAELDVETLVFDRNLTPSQASAIGKHADLKVIDRTQLILDIFAQRAESADGKLQVELAQLKYTLPRLAQKDDSLSRLTGGIGGRGPGETTLEVGRRRAKERVSALESRLSKLGQRREVRRRRRARLGVPVVSIVGYTNAGKSTLLNALTGAGVLAENKLFATLDPRSRRLRFPEEREVVITDTVGFIRNLPKELFAAFRATFEEAADADLLLHVVDASDPARDQHIETTEALLTDLDLNGVPRLLVFNKVDALSPEEARVLRLSHRGAVLVSALRPETAGPLLDKIAEQLKDRWDLARPAYARLEAAPASEEEVVVAEEPEADEPEELTTLEQMMGYGRRRSAVGA